MRTIGKKIGRAGVALFLALWCIGSFLCPASASESEPIASRILNAKTEGVEAEAWIASALPEAMSGEGAWYVLALEVQGYGVSPIAEKTRELLQNRLALPRATQAKYALSLMAAGADDTVIAAVSAEITTNDGIMPLIYGLHLRRNGCIGGDSAEALLASLLSRRTSDGGWAISGQYADADVTAMALQALAAYRTSEGVEEAIVGGLTALSARQNADGSFSSYGVANAESCAQVLTALSDCGVDLENEAFVKNGKTVLDALLSFVREDGGVCHAAGGEANAMATAQTYFALTVLSSGKLSYTVAHAAGKEYVYEKTAPTPTPLPTEEERESVPLYKWALGGGMLAAGLIYTAFLLLKKKASLRRLLTVWVSVSVGIALIFFLRIAGKNDYYGQKLDEAGAVGHVTFSIRCDTVAGKADYIPADGVIFAEAALPIGEGETVLSLTQALVRQEGISLDKSGSGEMSYLRGIAYLQEMAFGDLSGWVYRVNGEIPSVGCGAYSLRDGDRVEWLYSLSLGSDEGGEIP